MSARTRNLGTDMLCCLGVIMLLGLQYLAASGFPPAAAESPGIALPIAARWSCLSGAMLLAAGTGYSLSRQRCTAGYFTVLIRMVYLYLICSIAAFAIRFFVMQETLTPMEMLHALLQFTATDTSRFAAMYFALLTAAPFLNAAMDGLKSQKACLAFVCITAALSTLQPMLLIGETYLLPGWCKGLFPLAGYLGGAYLRRYSKKRHVPLLLLFLAAMCTLQTLIVVTVSLLRGAVFCPQLDSMASLPCLCTALCLVGLFHSKKPGDSGLNRFFGMAAEGALPALLLGDVLIDCMIPALEERFPTAGMRLWAGFGVVPVIFILSCALGLILQVPVFAIRSFLTEEEEETEEETEKPARRKHDNAAPSQRHTIQVPVPRKTAALRMTQPTDEAPPGVHEVNMPAPPEDAPSPSAPKAQAREAMSRTAKLYIPKTPARQETHAARREMSVEEILDMTEKPKTQTSSASVEELLERLTK